MPTTTQLPGVRRAFALAAAALLLAAHSLTVHSQSQQNNRVRPHIYGGTDALEGQFPWQVSVQERDTTNNNTFNHICGGSIIAPHWVLTAAHCVQPPHKMEAVAANDRRIVAGMVSLLDTRAKRFTVDRIVVHGDAKRTSPYPNDIALIRTVERMTGDRLQVIPLDLDDTLPTGQPWLVTGWGKNERWPTALMLSRLVVAYKPKSDCSIPARLPLNVPPDGMLCAGAGDSRTAYTCHGDSGGPLVAYPGWQTSQSGSAKLVGIVSWALNADCGQSPTIYTRVSQYVDWILRMISEPDERTVFVRAPGGNNQSPAPADFWRVGKTVSDAYSATRDRWQVEIRNAAQQNWTVLVGGLTSKMRNSGTRYEHCLTIPPAQVGSPPRPRAGFEFCKQVDIAIGEELGFWFRTPRFYDYSYSGEEDVDRGMLNDELIRRDPTYRMAKAIRASQ
jgi:secreted trypsin-like serine protease